MGGQGTTSRSQLNSSKEKKKSGRFLAPLGLKLASNNGVEFVSSET
jgi:hypothetical protein